MLISTSDLNDKPSFMGIARDTGADEDDFHVFKRSTAELDQQERLALMAAKKATPGLQIKPTKKVVVF